MNFIFSKEEDFHNIRRKEILKKHSKKVRSLMGYNPYTFIFIIIWTCLQLIIAYQLNQSSYFTIILFAWLIGAFINHGLYVFVHEASHNLIFKTTLANRFAGLISDIALIFPGSQAFRKYHIKHHNHMGEYDWDADLCSYQEAKLVENSRLKKVIWMFLFGVSQALRPNRLKKVNFLDKWIILNFVIQMTINALIFFTIGPKAFVYLLASTIFALGLHPLGGRWIAEHYIIYKKQETYSYYGIINKVMFNIGHHTEHHDFMNIPWNRLPKLREIAKEDFYDTQYSHSSYTKLLMTFIWNKKYSPFSRVIRQSR